MELLTFTLTPELKVVVPAAFEAAETKTYEPLGTVVVFHRHSHPKCFGVVVQITGAANPNVPPKSRNRTLVAFDAKASRTAERPDNAAPADGMSTLVVGRTSPVSYAPMSHGVGSHRPALIGSGAR